MKNLHTLHHRSGQVKEKIIHLKVEIRLTVMDKKGCDGVTGLGSTICDLCFLSKEEAHNQSMDLESTQQIYAIRSMLKMTVTLSLRRP